MIMATALTASSLDGAPSPGAPIRRFSGSTVSISTGPEMVARMPMTSHRPGSQVISSA